MTPTNPAVDAILAELGTAVRRDHLRRARRRKIARTSVAGAFALPALTTAALAATGAFKEVETVTPVGQVQLPNDVTIQAVDSFPEFVGRATPSGFTTSTGTAKLGHFIYHVTGGEAPQLGCGYPQTPTNNIYITSTRSLDEHEIRSLLEPDGQPKSRTMPPHWVTSISDGCPNPGIAGQPATPNEQLEPGKAAVATPTSSSTRILVRKRVKVPVDATALPTTPPNEATTSSSEATTQSSTSAARSE